MPRARALSGGNKAADSPVDKLIERIKAYLYLPDLSVMYVLLGAMAANMLDGYPVWLMLVGAPSDGKSELLNSLLGIPRTFALANISNESAFLSGMRGSGTGGILRQVGNHGAVVINDFTSILSQEFKVRNVILSVFREVFGGEWVRHLGVDGGKQLKWKGRVGFFAGSTGAIDMNHEVSAALGERWVYYRLEQDEVTNHEKSRRAMMNAADGLAWQQELRDLTAGFFAGLDLAFDKGNRPERGLADVEVSRIIGLASIAARCRSAVVRDKFTQDILGVRETETGARLATSLGQLMIGMDAIGVSEEQRWKALGRVGLDSMPAVRRLVVKALAATPRGVLAWPDLADAAKFSKGALIRAVEDLEIHGVVISEKADEHKWVRLLDQKEVEKWL